MKYLIILFCLCTCTPKKLKTDYAERKRYLESLCKDQFITEDERDELIGDLDNINEMEELR